MGRKSRLKPITMTGNEDLKIAMKQLMGSMEPKEVKKVLLEGARIIRDDAKKRVRKKTGTLRKAIRAKAFRNSHKTTPGAFAAVDRKKAPHGHLVEFGTVNAPPHPYMRPAAVATKGQVTTVVKKGLADGIDAIVRRQPRKPRRRKRK